MIVHFIASKSDIANNIGLLRKIVTAVHEEEHKLSLDWIEPAYVRQTTRQIEGPVDWNEAYKEAIEALTKADVVIAETSQNSFGVGYQVATALQQKKPMLLLRRANADSDAFALGPSDELMDHTTYKTDDEATKAVTKFLKDNDIQTKDMRFNFFIDRPIYNYLRWAAQKTGKTKAEILRDLVDREIKNQG
jgi:hypothetical protein